MPTGPILLANVTTTTVSIMNAARAAKGSRIGTKNLVEPTHFNPRTLPELVDSGFTVQALPAAARP